MTDKSGFGDGFVALGWTPDGDKVYSVGDEYTVKKDTYLFIKWKRTDLNSRMDFTPVK
ncbi:MAG: hypothetical protein IIX69_01045 [Clostridia bacterium]|nr:hypothetical protein [Clostridia bacterium]